MQMTVRSHYTSCRHPKKTVLLKSMKNTAVCVNTRFFQPKFLFSSELLCIMKCWITFDLKLLEGEPLELQHLTVERFCTLIQPRQLTSQTEESIMRSHPAEGSDSVPEIATMSLLTVNCQCALEQRPWPYTAPHSGFAWVGASAPLNLWNVCKWNRVVMSRVAHNSANALSVIRKSFWGNLRGW